MLAYVVRRLLQSLLVEWEGASTAPSHIPMTGLRRRRRRSKRGEAVAPAGT